jgi:hypothetical protein
MPRPAKSGCATAKLAHYPNLGTLPFAPSTLVLRIRAAPFAARVRSHSPKTFDF